MAIAEFRDDHREDRRPDPVPAAQPEEEAHGPGLVLLAPIIGLGLWVLIFALLLT